MEEYEILEEILRCAKNLKAEEAHGYLDMLIEIYESTDDTGLE
jgi:hypothetical protein